MKEQQGETVRIQDKEDEIDLLELLYFFQSRWVAIVAGFLAGALIAGVITQFLITPKFTAT